jgi:hypothetical protein
LAKEESAPMKTIQAFVTSDNKLFHSEATAAEHEMFLSKKDTVEEFLDSDLNPYKGHAHKGMAKITIINWELWKAQNVK